MLAMAEPAEAAAVHVGGSNATRAAEAAADVAEATKVSAAEAITPPAVFQQQAAVVKVERLQLL